MMRFIFLFACLVTKATFAQYGPNYSLPGLLGNSTLRFPWAGGLNNPQFSAADLDHDGLDDLVVFDRTGYRVLTFRNNGGAFPNNYDYEPKFESTFPPMDSWCLLVDFNCDNVPDIFTHTTLGIRVFKGFYNWQNRLDFELYKPLVRYQSTSGSLNLLVTSVDIAAFVDVTNDGDIDVVTFDSNGGQAWFFENKSQESGWGCDSLNYVMADDCWGDFYEGVQLPKYLDNCSYHFVVPGMPVTGTGGEETRHSGSTTLLFDNTGDGIKEAIVGDISFNQLVYLSNNGTITDAHMFAQDTAFPSYDVPSNISVFPAAFRLDVDNDGVKDLLAAPNAESGGNYSACSWLYKNNGTNSLGDFAFVTDSFLVNQMFDVGEGSKPVWFDFDADGLTDLLLANSRYYDTCSFVATFKNVGTVTNPAFKLTKRNYANLASLNKIDLHPTFGDLDGDGDADMLLGSEDGTLILFTNTAPAGSPAVFTFTQSDYFEIDVSGRSAPQLVDVDQDGVLDLLIGSSGTAGGKIKYYRNEGTATNADFTSLTNPAFGDVEPEPGHFDAASVPCLTTLPGFDGRVLLVGNRNGDMQLYDNIDGNLDGAFNLVTYNFSGIYGGRRTTVDAKDINGDGAVELVVGNQRGGITVYDSASFTTVSLPAMTNQTSRVRAYPNPTAGVVHLVSDRALLEGRFALVTVNALGQAVQTSMRAVDAYTLAVDASSLPGGVYVTRLLFGDSVSSCRWIKSD